MFFICQAKGGQVWWIFCHFLPMNSFTEMIMAMTTMLHTGFKSFWTTTLQAVYICQYFNLTPMFSEFKRRFLIQNHRKFGTGQACVAAPTMLISVAEGGVLMNDQSIHLQNFNLVHELVPNPVASTTHPTMPQKGPPILINQELNGWIPWMQSLWDFPALSLA